ncbi:MAG: ABC transporter permease [Chloroflexi bacterium]|nr:ABC transporter permease [Chloroflexota bacterium]
MSFYESLKTAITNLLSNKLRSLLTVLGIVIGVTAVIVLQSLGEGVIGIFTDNLAKQGSNIALITPNTQTVRGMDTGSTNRNLTYEDALALTSKNEVPSALAVEPEISTRTVVVYGSTNSVVSTIGTNELFPEVRSAEVQEGNWFSTDDLTAERTVAVVGPILATDLFGSEVSPIGQKININRNSFTVIGVLVAKGQNSFDKQLYIPITTAMHRIVGTNASNTGNSINTIIVKAINETQIQPMVLQIIELLRNRHKVPEEEKADFQVITSEDLLTFAKNILGVIEIFLTLVASITLLVGGIGVMNIMLVTVTERTREIGIRLAVGARQRDIMLQFLLESVTLCFSGGVMGCVIGIGISSLIGAANLELAGTFFRPVVTTSSIVISVSIVVTLGLFFGIYPARRAARLKPIDALRYD